MSSSTIFRRIGYGLAFLIVAGVAAYVSYGHIYEVAVLGHQPERLAFWMPLSVDGLMLIATMAMAEDKAAHRHPRGWARFSFWFGAAISTAANIAASAVHYGDPLSIAVASFAPLALLLAIEIVARPGKPKIEPAIPQVVAPVAATATVESPAIEDTTIAAPAAITAAARQPRRQTVTEPVDRKYSERHERRLRRGR